MTHPLPPSKEVLDAFSITDEPVLLEGGQGLSWKAGDVVFKPVNSDEEAIWCADLIETLPQDRFRTAQHKRAKNNAWVYDHWEAIEFIEGAHLKGSWKEKIAVCNGFSELLSSVPKPDFIDKRTHPWAMAGKMVFNELPLTFNERLASYVGIVEQYLRPVEAESQIVHGDITGNMLFAPSLPPGIIDFTPIYRPKEFALAILMVDALTWEEADESIFTLISQEKNMFQFLLRAALFRTLVTSEFYRQRGIDRISELPKHERVLEILLRSKPHLS